MNERNRKQIEPETRAEIGQRFDDLRNSLWQVVLDLQGGRSINKLTAEAQAVQKVRLELYFQRANVMKGMYAPAQETLLVFTMAV